MNDFIATFGGLILLILFGALVSVFFAHVQPARTQASAFPRDSRF